MIIKINDEIYDPEETPMMLILTEQDKLNIEAMRDGLSRYGVFPEAWGTVDERVVWMDQLPLKVIEEYAIKVTWTPWRDVQSSNLSAIRFKPDNEGYDTGWLDVRFKSGAVYRYREVPDWIFFDLSNPELPVSKGQYFSKSVKDGGYKFEKVKE